LRSRVIVFWKKGTLVETNPKMPRISPIWEAKIKAMRNGEKVLDEKALERAEESE